MKRYLAIYLGTDAGHATWKAMDPKTREAREKAGIKAWMTWATDHAESIVDNGSPLGKTKRVDIRGVSDSKNAVAAYTVVQAESHEAAAALFVEHPHFTIFPGEAVELMECLPIPGQ